MLSIQVHDNLHAELKTIFKQYGLEFDRYETIEDEHNWNTVINMYFSVYGVPHGLSYSISEINLYNYTSMSVECMLVDYVHRQLSTLDKTANWELVPKT